MASQTRPRLRAEPRSGVHKKSALRDLRRSGQVPGLIYGHGDPQAIQVSARALSDHLRHHAPAALMDLDLEGKTTTTLIRELDRDPITGTVIHLGFQRINLSENIRSTIPLVFHGEEALIGNGLVFERQLTDLEVHGRADQLPESFVVDVGEAEAGHMFRVADLEVPSGIEVTRDPETVIARVTEPRVAPEVEAALEAEEAAHAAAAQEREEEAADEAAPAEA